MLTVAGMGGLNCDLLYVDLPRIPSEGEEIYAKDFQIQFGGGIPASMISLSRLGVKTKLLTFLGTDMFSEFLKKELDRFGVEYVNLYRGDKIPLTVSSCLITRKDRSFVSYAGCFVGEVPDIESVYKMLKEYDVIDMSIGGNIELYQRLKADGKKIVLDVGWDDELSLEMLEPYFAVCDYFLPNRAEALKITGENNIGDAVKILKRYFPTVIVKLDSEGCILYDGDMFTLIPPVEGIVAIDSTGAGDAFMSGFLYGLCNQATVAKCAAYGNAAGGACVQGVGCLTNHMEAEELELTARNLLAKSRQCNKVAY